MSFAATIQKMVADPKIPMMHDRQIALLTILGEPGEHHVRHLATRMRCSKAVVVRSMDRLTKLGYGIRIRKGLLDQRSPILTLTKGGEKLLARISDIEARHG